MNSAKEFLKIAEKFKLGNLPTESPHPKTQGLSSLAKSDLVGAISLLKDIDIDCLSTLEAKLAEVMVLQEDVKKVLSSGGRIFLCGCGATGRLSLALERVWREHREGDSRVISFMAGGDVALISSIEKFEDYTEYGARQLMDLGFRQGDMLIASTEGGETPWVIGAVEKACEVSEVSSYFAYCNPDEVLVSQVERSKNVILNKKIKKLNLYTGQMALAGSTRMQASTILMLGVGLALLYEKESSDQMKSDFLKFKKDFLNLDLSLISKLITSEAGVYQKGDYCHYLCDSHLGISILTDTTERAPTFSLRSFENYHNETQTPSLCYLSYSNHENSTEAWHKLLGRPPRCIDWSEVSHLASEEKLLGHLIGKEGILKRNDLIGSKENLFFRITYQGENISLDFKEINFSFSKQKNALFDHILLKMILNIHSTLIMGLLGRYESNIMTWVRASNNKLIDRTARNVQYLAGSNDVSYEEIIEKIFSLRQNTKEDEALVLKVLNSL
ncbi:hypothetical protein N9O57_01900 [bacterium]|nr:hypothetical protein [bacterium]